MTTTLRGPGIDIQSAAETAVVQHAKVSDKTDKSTLMTTVSGKAQVTEVFDYNQRFEFEVKGSGDFTMASGLGQSPDLTLITGGVSFIDDFSYEQDIAKPSEWSYSGVNYPSAA